MLKIINQRRIRFLKTCISLLTVISMFVIVLFGEELHAFAVEEDGYEPSEYRLQNEAINEWEDRVLIAATGQLKNEGRVYYAYGDYVDELISYFTKDDLDLTEKDANDAISEITNPDNAKAGAMSGYLYQIGGKPKDSDSLVANGEYDGKVYPEFDESIRFANESDYRKSDLYKNNKSYIEERTNTVYESQSAMREEMRKIALSDRTYQNLLKTRPANASASVESLTFPRSTGIILVIIAALLLVLTVAVIIYSWRNGTIRLLLDIDDEHWNRSNSRKDRHRIRKVSAKVLAAVVAVDLIVVYAALTFYSTFGSNNYLEQAMDESGICQHCYMDFRDDVHSYLGENNLPQNSLDRALTYREYKFDYIKGVRSAIKNGSGDITYRGVQDSVQDQIDLLAYITKKDSSNVVSNISEIYENSLSAKVGVFIHDLRESLKGPYVAGLIMSIISLLLAAAMLVAERHNVYKGVRDLAIGALAGTGLWAVITAIMAFGKVKTPGLTDDQTYVMFTTAIADLPGVMLILLVVSAVISALLFGTSWLMERRS